MRELPTAIAELRVATAEAHQALDASLDVQRRLSGGPMRIDMLQGYFAMHAAAEAAIIPLLSGFPRLEVSTRRRSPLVQEDLRRLGVEPVMPARFCVAGWGEALGLLYVLEGSSLGGRVILRNLQADGIPTDCLSFLNPYGARTGAMWRVLLEELETELANPALRAAAVAGARAGFAHAYACLRPNVEQPELAGT